MKHRISKDKLLQEHDFPTPSFPKYTTQIINIANQNAKGTVPASVGQLSELFPEYRNSGETQSLEGWSEWYTERHPDTIDKATDKIEKQIANLKQAINLIDRDMVKSWVTDLVINKTSMGLYFQQVILEHLAQQEGCEWRLGTPDEEVKGIDGYVGDHAYSVKPKSYKAKNMLPETIDVTMIFYTYNKQSGTLTFTIED